MEFLQLQYFCELAVRQHLTQTASAMMVSPSAISTSISRLESELGVKLFDRVGRTLRLNSYGEAFFSHAKRALTEIEDGQQELADLLGNQNPQITVATTNPYVWQMPLRSFQQAHPHIRLKHILFDPLLSKTALPPEDTDIIIASPDAFSNPEWESVRLFSDNIVLAVAPDHPFASRTSIALSEAKDEWFVGLSNSSFSEYCNELCRKAGFEPKIKMECDYMVRPEVVLSDKMVCLTTYNGRNVGIFKDIPLISLNDVPTQRDQALFWKKARYVSSPVRLFRDYMVDFYRNYLPETSDI